MIVIECDNIVYVDVDDTLIAWTFDSNKKKVKITCDGKTKFYNPIQTNIDYLKEHRYRGHRVILWSHGGWKWAKAVAKALKLEEYVDVVASKPRWIIDDLEPSEWMPNASFGNQDPAREIKGRK